MNKILPFLILALACLPFGMVGCGSNEKELDATSSEFSGAISKTYKNLCPAAGKGALEHKLFRTHNSIWSNKVIEFYPDNKARVASYSCTLVLGVSGEPNGEFSIQGHNIAVKVTDVSDLFPRLAGMETEISTRERAYIKDLEYRLNNLESTEGSEQERKKLQERLKAVRVGYQEAQTILQGGIQRTQAFAKKEWGGPHVLYENPNYYFLIERSYFKDDTLPKNITIQSDKCPVYLYPKNKEAEKALWDWEAD